MSTVFTQNLLAQLTIMSSRWILAYDLHCFLESQGHSGLSQGHSGLDILLLYKHVKISTHKGSIVIVFKCDFAICSCLPMLSSITVSV